MFGNHGLGGLLEEGAHEKSPKCPGGNLGDFWGIFGGFCKGLSPFENDKVPWRPWQHAIKIAGVRYRKPYNTRHTFATLNLMAGANPMWVARQMGHSTMKMLLENYSRWIDLADKQREKSKIEQLFDGKCANSVPKNTEMKISIGYLSDILVEAGSSVL